VSPINAAVAATAAAGRKLTMVDGRSARIHLVERCVACSVNKRHATGRHATPCSEYIKAARMRRDWWRHEMRKLDVAGVEAALIVFRSADGAEPARRRLRLLLVARVHGYDNHLVRTAWIHSSSDRPAIVLSYNSRSVRWHPFSDVDKWYFAAKTRRVCSIDPLPILYWFPFVRLFVFFCVTSFVMLRFCHKNHNLKSILSLTEKCVRRDPSWWPAEAVTDGRPLGVIPAAPSGCVGVVMPGWKDRTTPGRGRHVAAGSSCFDAPISSRFIHVGFTGARDKQLTTKRGWYDVWCSRSNRWVWCGQERHVSCDSANVNITKLIARPRWCAMNTLAKIHNWIKCSLLLFLSLLLKLLFYCLLFHLLLLFRRIMTKWT